MHRRIRVFEARAARGETGDELRRPIADDDPALVDEDLRDPHRNRAMPGGVRSWSKGQHLDRLVASGHFAFTRELVFDEPATADGADDGRGAERFVALMRSQGSYQGLLRLGMTDDELGATDFEREVHAAFARRRREPRPVVLLARPPRRDRAHAIASSGADDLERGGVFASHFGAGVDRPVGEHLAGVGVDVVEVRPVLLERLDAVLQPSGDVDVVGRLR